MPIDGSIEALGELSKHGKVVIVTLGERLQQMKKVAYLGLADLTVEVVPEKVTAIYTYLKAKYPAKRHFMVGDNIQKDVYPAMEAGIDFVYHISAKAGSQMRMRVHNPTGEAVQTPEEAADNRIYMEVSSLRDAVISQLINEGKYQGELVRI
jgi:FMN phosphatase YigB (HAD superfamily)